MTVSLGAVVGEELMCFHVTTSSKKKGEMDSMVKQYWNKAKSGQ